MFSVCFIVAGMDKRKHLLEECIEAYKNSRYYGIDIFLYYQGEEFDSVKGKEVFGDVIIDSKPRGVFTPRYELMKRFGYAYDYVIIIDDDLFIQPETDYFKTIKYMETYRNVGATCLLHTERAVKNLIKSVNDGSEYFNVAGGLVISREAVACILEYFKDKEKDYTFDCFWLLLWIKGFDISKDYRSWAKHVASRKIDGQFTGFNEMRTVLEYVPIMTEYLNEPKTVFNHGQYEVDLPTINDINDSGLRERIRCRYEKSVHNRDNQ